MTTETGTRTTLPHRLEREITVQARRDTVFRFFTDADRWARWWGPGSTIDARPGGAVRIRYPGGAEASGEVLEVLAPERIRFTYGYETGQPFPPGSTRITIELEAEGQSTRLHFLHEFADAVARDAHVDGWRYQLSLFGNAVSDEVNAAAAEVADAWFQVWAEPDPKARHRALAQIAIPAVRFRDRYGLIDGIPDLVAHIGASQKYMPGYRLERRGDVRHCQGTALVEWIARSDQGEERASGTNVFSLGSDGRIDAVTGLWNTLAS
jgi:uncharacterized protein YndB with AHSA1/START domain